MADDVIVRAKWPIYTDDNSNNNDKHYDLRNRVSDIRKKQEKQQETRKVEDEDEQEELAQLALGKERREECREYILCYQKQLAECTHIIDEIETQLAIIESHESGERDDYIDNIRREYENKLKEMEEMSMVAVYNIDEETEKADRAQDQINYYDYVIDLREETRKELEIERAELKERAQQKMTAAKFAWAAAKTKAATQRREVREVTNIGVHSLQYRINEMSNKERTIRIEPWTMTLNSLVESDEELKRDDDDDDDGVGLEKEDGNTERNVEDKVSSADNTDIVLHIGKMLQSSTNNMKKRCEDFLISFKEKQERIEAFVVDARKDKNNNNNKNDEDKSQENDDDDGQAAAVLFTDNTNDKNALKENRTREQTEDRNITSREKTENHPCFRYPTREELDGAEKHFQPLRDEVSHKEEREKWERVTKTQHRKKKTDNKASETPDGVTTEHTNADIRRVLDDNQRTYTTQKKDTHRNEELDKWEIVTKKRHKTTDDKANESPTDATNPNENTYNDNGSDIDDITTKITHERHSEPQKEQRDMQSGAIATKKKQKKKQKKKKKNTNTSQCALPKPLHTIVTRSILERNIQVEDMLMQNWHKIINLEDLIREKNEEITKMCAKVLLALHRKDTKILEKRYMTRDPNQWAVI